MLQRLELSNEHAEWLETKRRIPSEIAAEIGFVSKGNKLAFEFRRNGECVFRKIRTPIRNEDGSEDKTFHIDPPGNALFLFNEDCLSEECSPETPLIICEGEMDAASWMVAGATRVVSVPNGATNKPGEGDIDPHKDRQFAYLWENGKLKSSLQAFNKIILGMDNDPAGLVMRDELAIRLGRDRCYIVNYPEGCKDANDVLQKYPEDGPSILMDILDAARPLVADRLVPLVDIPVRETRQRYDTGWKDLDEHLMIMPPELMIVTGTPGSGKSQWTLALVMNLARRHKLRGAILQFEDDPDRNLKDIRRYAEHWTKPGNESEKAGILPLNSEQWARKMFLGISPSEDEDDSTKFDLKWLQNAIAEAATRHGCKWILIDPWNEIQHLWGVSESETKYTNDALKELKRLGRRYQIAIIIVAHPAKTIKGKPIEELDLYDVSGSKAWNDKADHGIVIHRNPQDTKQIFVKVSKSKRWELMGRPGTAIMEFFPERAGFTVVKKL